MYCERKTLDVCFRSLRQQAELLLEKNKGIDVSIKEHKNKRTLEQNAWLFAVYKHIVDFYNETGFFLDNIRLRFCNTDLVHEYCKARYGIRTTTKLSTKEIGEYIEAIQRDLIEQTRGEYEPIYPPEKDYFEATHYEECTGKS